MKKTIFTIVLLLAFAVNIFSQITNPSSTAEKTDYKYSINDAHCHYVDFVQNTEGVDVLLKQWTQQVLIILFYLVYQ